MTASGLPSVKRRKWEEESALEFTVGRVDERLFDGGAGQAITNIDIDLMIADVEWHIAVIDLGQQLAERFIDDFSVKRRYAARIFC